jgi:transcriptional regulator with XRE-family HTH domain
MMSPKDLRTKRLELGWTHQQLADSCGIPVTQLIAWEEGEAEIDQEELLLTVFRGATGSNSP